MKSKIKYQVIYSLDIPKDSNKTISECKFDLLNKRSIFEVTEDQVEETEYYKIHRKYVGLLTADQTLEFLQEIGAYSTCETGGALSFFGWLPAISFETDNFSYGYSDCAYISPLPLANFPENFNPENNDQDRLIDQNEIQPIFESLMEDLRKVLESETLKSEMEFNLDQTFLDLN